MYHNGYLYEELLNCILGNWRNIVHSGAHLVVQEVAKRESLGAVPCGPDEHKLNLYIGGNLQAINEFIKARLRIGRVLQTGNQTSFASALWPESQFDC